MQQNSYVNSYALNSEKELLNSTSYKIKSAITLAYIYYAKNRDFDISIRGILENELITISDLLSDATSVSFHVIDKHIVLKKNLKKEKDLPDKQILTEKLKQCGYAVRNLDLYYKEYEDKFF